MKLIECYGTMSDFTGGNENVKSLNCLFGGWVALVVQCSAHGLKVGSSILAHGSLTW